MPITVGKAGDNTATGWTSITPKPDTAWNSAGKYPAAWLYHQGTGYPPASGSQPSGYPVATGDGTRFIFVGPTPGAANTAGAANDANPGTLQYPKLNFDGNVQNPYPSGPYTWTGQGALTAVRGAGYPDWICLQNGGTYNNSNVFEVGGGQLDLRGEAITLDANRHSSGTPIVIAGFDWSASMLPPVPNPGTGGAHPILNMVTNSTYQNSVAGQYSSMFNGNTRGQQDGFAILGITFTTQTPVYGYYLGIFPNTGTPRSFWLIEDCELSNLYEGGGFFQGSGLDNNIFVRRCRILYNSGQGLYGPHATNVFYEENLFRHNGWSNTAASVSTQQHNFYRGSTGLDAGIAGLSTPCNETGNIYAELGDNDGARCGLIASNNLWITNPHPMVTFGLLTSTPGHVDSCVWDEGVAPLNNPGAGCDGILFQGQSLGYGPNNGRRTCYFQGEYFNKAGATVNNCLFVHNTVGAGVVTGSGMDGIVCTNNVLYDSPSWVFQDTNPGAVKTFSISGGSGYTNSAIFTGTAPQAAAQDSTNYQNATGTRFTVTDNSSFGQNTHLWVETTGRPGGDVAGLYFCSTNGPNAGTIYVWFPELPFTGTCTCSIYVPVIDVAFTTTGGGTGFTGNVIVKGGQIISVDQCTTQNTSGGYTSISFNGFGYSVGNVLTQSTITGGSGFSLTVTAICNNNMTDASNKFYASTTPPTIPSGSGFTDTTRSVTTYAQTVLGLTATADRYGASSVLNTFLTNVATYQVRSSWSSQYTAKAVNDWIRQGFGMPSTSIFISPSTLPPGAVGTVYGPITFSASGGTAPYTWTHSGTIPPGLTFNDVTAVLDGGAPTSAVGSPFAFRINATDSAGTPVTGYTDYTVTITAPAITISPSSLPPGTIGVGYNQTVTATGGTAPYTYAVSSGSLPPGLTLNTSSGAITGTPTGSSNIYPFAITAADSLSNSSLPQGYNIQILAAPAQPKVSPMGAACM